MRMDWNHDIFVCYCNRGVIGSWWLKPGWIVLILVYLHRPCDRLIMYHGRQCRSSVFPNVTHTKYHSIIPSYIPLGVETMPSRDPMSAKARRCRPMVWVNGYQQNSVARILAVTTISCASWQFSIAETHQVARFVSTVQISTFSAESWRSIHWHFE